MLLFEKSVSEKQKQKFFFLLLINFFFLVLFHRKGKSQDTPEQPYDGEDDECVIDDENIQDAEKVEEIVK